MWIEAGGNKNPFRFEFFGRRDDHILKDTHILRISAARRKGDIDRVSFARVPPHLINGARSRIIGKLMGGNKQYRRILVKGLLRSIAVMDTPVNNHDPLGAIGILQMISADRDSLEQAEPHSTISQRVMPWRAHQSKPIL